MDIIDIIILVILVTFALIGFKRGFFKSLVSFVGFLIVICAAYIFKNYLGDLFLLNLPFFKFNTIAGGAVTLNIVLYQLIAFIIMLIVFGLVYRFLLAVTGLFEKLLKITIILGIPSKILGLIFGALEGFVIVYLLLFFLAQPFVKLDLLKNSSFSKTILNDTPVLSSFAESTLIIVNEVSEAVNISEDEDINLKIGDLILKQKVTTPEVMQKLVDSKKIEVDGMQEIIDKYATVMTESDNLEDNNNGGDGID